MKNEQDYTALFSYMKGSQIKESLYSGKHSTAKEHATLLNLKKYIQIASYYIMTYR